MKFCSRCNENFDNNLNFCPKCGKELIVEKETNYVINNGELKKIELGDLCLKSKDSFDSDFHFNHSDSDKIYLWFAGVSARYINYGEWKYRSTLNIPHGVTKLADSLYVQACSYELNFPSSLSAIDGGSNFYYCHFYNVNIPGSVKRIRGLLWECKIDGAIKLDYGVERIEFLCQKSYINKIILPKSLKEILPGTFNGSRIKELVVPKSVTHWAYGDYYQGMVTRYENLRYEGSKSELRRLLESSLSNTSKVRVNEDQIIHCSDGDVRCINVNDTTFKVVDA